MFRTVKHRGLEHCLHYKPLEENIIHACLDLTLIMTKVILLTSLAFLIMAALSMGLIVNGSIILTPIPDLATSSAAVMASGRVTPAVTISTWSFFVEYTILALPI